MVFTENDHPRQQLEGPIAVFALLHKSAQVTKDVNDFLNGSKLSDNIFAILYDPSLASMRGVLTYLVDGTSKARGDLLRRAFLTCEQFSATDKLRSIVFLNALLVQPKFLHELAPYAVDIPYPGFESEVMAYLTTYEAQISFASSYPIDQPSLSVLLQFQVFDNYEGYIDFAASYSDTYGSEDRMAGFYACIARAHRNSLEESC